MKSALDKINRNKAAGPEGILTEILSASGDFGINKIIEVINEIYDSGDITENLTTCIFVTLPKKTGAN